MQYENTVHSFICVQFVHYVELPDFPLISRQILMTFNNAHDKHDQALSQGERRENIPLTR